MFRAAHSRQSLRLIRESGVETPERLPRVTSARLDRGGRPTRLCLHIALQFAGRKANAKAEGLAETALLERIAF